jgi:hypothetical protein
MTTHSKPGTAAAVLCIFLAAAVGPVSAQDAGGTGSSGLASSEATSTSAGLTGTPADVMEEFLRIPRSGVAHRARAGDTIPAPAYTARIDNRLGFRNHFQGVQRIPGTDFLVVSGSDPRGPASSLFVLRFGHPGRRTHEPDRVLAEVPLDSTLWHAGGMSTMGRILAVPIYGGKPRHGRVLFFDTATAPQLESLAVTIERPGRKAYATAIARLQSGHVLVAVLAGRDDLPRRLDFYRSRTARLADGFDHEPVTWPAREVRSVAGQSPNFGDFQGIGLVTQRDGSLFLVGLHNTAPSIDLLPGRDYADLYRVEFPGSEVLSAPGAMLTKPRLTKVANRHLVCEGGHCNLDASAGLYVDPSGQLGIYATSFWLGNGELKLTEFLPGDPGGR